LACGPFPPFLPFLSSSRGRHPCPPDPTGLDRDCQFTSFLTVSGRALFLRESICAVKQACESSLVGVVGAPKRRPQRAGRRAAPQGDGQRARLGLGVVRSAGRGRGARREGLERRNTTARDEEGAVALREHMCSTTAPPGETVRSSSGGEASAAARGRDQGGAHRLTALKVDLSCGFLRARLRAGGECLGAGLGS
jgi:hypothetical protein